MNALDRRFGNGGRRFASHLFEQCPGVPINRPALPKPKLAAGKDRVDLIAIAVADKLPCQIVRGGELGPIEIDEQEIGLSLIHI